MYTEARDLCVVLLVHSNWETALGGEALAAAKLRFQRMDENHDVVIDAGELAALKARMAERANAGRGGGGRGDQLAEMDANGDGQITQDLKQGH